MKKYGFTLIELLAVIVILAIIALIATPMILGVIESSRKGAIENSAYGYIESLENTTLKEMLEDSSYTLTVGSHDINEFASEYKGTGPSEGIVTIDSNKQISDAVLCINNYYVHYDGLRAKVDDTKTCADLPNAKTYEVGDLYNVEVKAGSIYGFRIIKDNKDGTVDAIMTKNLVDYVAWLSDEDQAASGKAGIKAGPITALNTLKNATDDWINVESLSSSYNYTDSSSVGNYTIDYMGRKARLLTAEEAASLLNRSWDGNEINYHINSVPNGWLFENTLEGEDRYGYWLASAGTFEEYQSGGSYKTQNGATAILRNIQYSTTCTLTLYSPNYLKKQGETDEFWRWGAYIGIRPVIRVQTSKLLPYEG